MALIKETVQDKVEVLEDGTLQIREVTRVKEGNDIVAQSYHRRVVTPLDDVTAETGLAKEIADKIFTISRKAAYQSKLNANSNSPVN